MTRQERLAKRRARYAEIQKPAPAPEEKKGTSWADTLLKTLLFNKKSKEQQEASKEKQQATDKVADATKPNPNPTPTPPSASKEYREQSRLKRELRKKDKEHKKIAALYEEAIRKGVAKEGSLESLQLKEIIRENYDEVSKAIKNAPEPQVTKKQNLDKEIATMHRKQLQKSGVQYVNPAVNNNIQ